nr:FkbM family methyltransferase [Methylohalomonas lacus]
MYKRGWRGINIDIDPVKIEGFNMVRTEDVNIACAVSDNCESEEAIFYTNGFYSLTTSLDANFVSDFSKKTNKKYEKSYTPIKTLSSLIEQTKYKETPIDFLTIDAEGHDFNIICSLDFSTYHPRVIAIESHFRLLSEVLESPVYKMLTEKSYDLVAWHGYTLLFANKEIQDKLRTVNSEA